MKDNVPCIHEGCFNPWTITVSQRLEYFNFPFLSENPNVDRKFKTASNVSCKILCSTQENQKKFYDKI